MKNIFICSTIYQAKPRIQNLKLIDLYMNKNKSSKTLTIKDP